MIKITILSLENTLRRVDDVEKQWKLVRFLCKTKFVVYEAQTPLGLGVSRLGVSRCQTHIGVGHCVTLTLVITLNCVISHIIIGVSCQCPVFVYVSVLHSL
jgi:hypothetical protein